MNEQMNVEIQEAIKKSLPAHVGDVLQEVIKKGKEDAISLSNALQRVIDLTVQNESLKKTIESYKALDDRNAGLEVREKAVDLKERQMEIEKLKHELACSMTRGNDIKELVAILVKNPMAIDLMRSTTSVPLKNQYGGTDYANEMRTETHIKGHTKGVANEYTPESDIS